MIDARELRIGNWVIDGCDLTGQITSLSNYRIYIDEAENYAPEKINPIPLTTEILEKCGFHKQSDKTATGFTRYCVTGMMLLLDHSENPFSNIEVYFERHFGLYECVGQKRDLKLHQLQNLYYALNQKELECSLLLS